MTILQGKYAPLCICLFIVVLIFVLLIATTSDGTIAAAYVNGITANLFDPFVWVIAFLYAFRAQRQARLFFTLFGLAVLLVAFKLYMRQTTGSGWLSGSVGGNLVGFITLGYLINAASGLRRSKKPPASEGGT